MTTVTPDFDPEPITMLPGLDELRAKWAHDARALRILADFDHLAAPGTRIWVYGQECFAATVVGLSVDLHEMLLGGVDMLAPVLCAPLLAATRDDTGELFQVGPVVAVPLAAAEAGWHVVDAAGLLVAGGPNIDEAKARRIAARYGEGHGVRLGVPVGGVDRRPDDGLGVFDPENPIY